jgi:hypothetical protein
MGRRGIWVLPGEAGNAAMREYLKERNKKFDGDCDQMRGALLRGGWRHQEGLCGALLPVQLLPLATYGCRVVCSTCVVLCCRDSCCLFQPTPRLLPVSSALAAGTATSTAQAELLRRLGAEVGKDALNGNSWTRYMSL